MSMLSVENLCVSYGAVQALRGVQLHVNAGEIVALLGVNGAGKSSLLRTICGQVQRTSGDILFEGEQIAGASPLAIVRKGIILCPEGRELFPTLTITENLKLGAIRTGVAWKNLKDDLDVLAELFPVIRQREHQKAETLSGGEQQMVAIARALMARPRLLLLDEPSLGVAPALSRQIFARLRAVADSDRGIVLVEQNARLALSIADRAYVIRNGEIVSHGSGCKVYSLIFGEDAPTGLSSRQ
jgi:branched-chain amino acid transport system ATP-binding protein